jgi:hypothetical protein
VFGCGLLALHGAPISKEFYREAHILLKEYPIYIVD